MKYNKDIYKNRLDLINKIEEADKAYWDYVNQFDRYNIKQWSNKKDFSLRKNISDLVIELNKANNLYYHENKWIYDYCKDYINNLNLTGEKLIDYVANELNKLAGVVVYKIDNDKLHNYEITLITPYKTYSYYLNRGYAYQYRIVPNGQGKANIYRLVQKHPCELLYDLGGNEELDDNIINNYLKK